ncbi:MAG TPA: hypothetical protein VL981_13890 [Candidatus Methylacidiphilales bacterium]|nr:hypothetical protein [Candidatus Methylacidiphilales bacterium]
MAATFPAMSNPSQAEIRYPSTPRSILRMTTSKARGHGGNLVVEELSSLTVDAQRKLSIAAIEATNS